MQATSSVNRRLSAAALLAALLALLLPAGARADLTNLGHLDFLSARVAPPAQAGHTTYRLGDEPEIGVLWTYADRRENGAYERIGGGPYDPATNTYAQGAFNADDVSRAAVVYARHWDATGAPASRDRARDLLRGITYLQTADGPNAGNVVLWMQPDGKLNPSAEPVELPDPSDSGQSYWLARTVWALGEGYRSFRDEDPAFAAFLGARMELALGALERQVLVRYGETQVVDGLAVPAWLIADGADATAEAILGLSAFVEAGAGGGRARLALARLSEGVARMGAGTTRDWPYGAVLPWALSRSVWHAWGSQMAAALARASARLGRGDLLEPALADAASFTPHLLVAGGPDNGWNPAPTDRTQIAYGADSRLQSLLAVADAARRPGLRRLAGFAGAWYFGANAAGAPMYDPATGRTFDGVSAEGMINRNSGAESTIHGLLSILALDAAPDVTRWARVAGVAERRTWRVLEAEAAAASGGASVVRPPDAWTGEAAWSGGAYVSLPPGGALSFGMAATEPSLLQPVALRTEGAGGGATRWAAPTTRPLGTLSHEDAGPQGVSPAPGVLEVRRLPRQPEPGAPVSVAQAGIGTTSLDAVIAQPLVEHVTLAGDGRGQMLLRSFAGSARTVSVALPGDGLATASAYDARGWLVTRRSVRGATVGARVAAGGFTIVER